MKTCIPFFIITLALLNNSNAQKPSFGVTVGASFAYCKREYDFMEVLSLTSKIKNGYTAGLISSFSLGKKFSFQPAVNFVQKGGITKELELNDKLTLNYIEIPLNFVYNIHLSKDLLFIGIGPSLSLGLSGKRKYFGPLSLRESDIKFGSGDDADLKPFEAGANLVAGYQFKNGLLIATNYNAGISDIAPPVNPAIDNIKRTFHNRYWGIRIGYMFPSEKK